MGQSIIQHIISTSRRQSQNEEMLDKVSLMAIKVRGSCYSVFSAIISSVNVNINMRALAETLSSRGALKTSNDKKGACSLVINTQKTILLWTLSYETAAPLLWMKRQEINYILHFLIVPMVNILLDIPFRSKLRY